MVFSFESPMRRGLIEITGSDATIEVPDPNLFGGDIRIVRAAAKRRTVVHADRAGYGRGIGVLDLARAIRAGERERRGASLSGLDWAIA